MILIVEVGHWLFMDRHAADMADVPTILVEKDQTGARSFTPMRTLFQLKKWTAARRFIPLLSCDETAYKAYEVFHVDALPSYALLQGGRVLLERNERDVEYEAALAQVDATSDEAVVAFAVRYLQDKLGNDVILAANGTVPGVTYVPNDVYVDGDVVKTGQQLFAWANEKERGSAT
ncbi:hypothetical protein [Exiguobacterium aurantiacum]|uniref:Uncharacterized protein n=1 Tax=Exiguobacterium aurantiacum TaxID=33987 RepID=A0A377FVW4_9BACL|nr:hypothetical protein [Exiguobacterium aurantiacum]STO08626.1 Uncharacterised protein [Exiguobacterium aurantiacum]